MTTTRNLTIMFTDIVGYTARTALQSRAEHAALLAKHDRLLRPLIQRHRGTLVKSMGDGMLVSFSSTTEGLRCAMAMQDALARYNRGRSEDRHIVLRIGLASGDVQVSPSDVFGEAVNIASRIEALTPPGAIYFSASVYLAMNKVEVAAEFVDRRELKGVPLALDIYRVMPIDADGRYLPDEPAAQASASPISSLRWWPLLVAALLLVAILAVLWPRLHADDPEGPTGPPRSGLETDARSTVGAVDPQERLAAIESSLADGDVAQAQAILREVLAASDSSSAILLAQGHLAFAREQRETGANIYQKALELSPDLANNPRLARNLVSALGWETGLAVDLIERYISPAIVDALQVRTGQSGYWGRLHAGRVLAAVGHAGRIMGLEAALLDLKEAEGCDRKRDAIARLAALGDERALNALKPYAEMSILRQFASPDSCLVTPARTAVEQIQAAKRGS